VKLPSLLALSLALASLPAAGQTAVTPSRTTVDRLARMEDIRPWQGMVVGMDSGAVVIAAIVNPLPGVALRAGDAVLRVGRTPVSDVAGLAAAYDAAAPGSTVVMEIRRAGAVRILRFVRPPDAPTLRMERRRLEPSALHRR
jgi:C-terminal processing protease CtpA/Prc